MYNASHWNRLSSSFSIHSLLNSLLCPFYKTMSWKQINLCFCCAALYADFTALCFRKFASCYSKSAWNLSSDIMRNIAASRLIASPSRAVAEYCNEYVCVRVRVSFCLCVKISPEPNARSLPNVFACACCLWLCLPPASLRYVRNFRFYGWHSVILYNGPYSGMNFATKDLFSLNLVFVYREVKHNSISYYWRA